ncbi:hypothetical protein PWG14_20790 (plasmid) [Chromobacterium amazonense]|uniref:hypothetical protein n=1 Tax=Chromobacterium amazonense TaxID=1382803 RepID=UPI00237E98A6|nr:hypothetical protein [Chromobacterium amazonense]MDE1714929.1 hypothetical protein [Chromobacterium amazonense]
MTPTDKATLAIGLLGAGAVTTGAALLHPAAGWIVGGLFGLAWSYLTARAAARGAA